MGSARRRPVRRILLVGFMGSGKSTVGSRLAALLGWEFLDIDEAVERATGLAVPEIFRRRGEAYFRDREHEATFDALQRDRHVLASGGGWPAVPGRMESLAPATASVFLDVGVDALVARLERDDSSRPLLSSSNRREEIRELLERRRPFYRLARLRVDGEAAPDAVAHSIVEALSEELGVRSHEPTTHDGVP